MSAHATAIAAAVSRAEAASGTRSAKSVTLRPLRESQEAQHTACSG
ncbi:hypothetical protein AB0L99_11915 [Streptomyces sp. NPDC051954]